jgi:hypothetical protein
MATAAVLNDVLLWSDKKYRALLEDFSSIVFSLQVQLLMVDRTVQMLHRDTAQRSIRYFREKGLAEHAAANAERKEVAKDVGFTAQQKAFPIEEPAKDEWKIVLSLPPPEEPMLNFSDASKTTCTRAAILEIPSLPVEVARPSEAVPRRDKPTASAENSWRQAAAEELLRQEAETRDRLRTEAFARVQECSEIHQAELKTFLVASLVAPPKRGDPQDAAQGPPRTSGGPEGQAVASPQRDVGPSTERKLPGIAAKKPARSFAFGSF